MGLSGSALVQHERNSQREQNKIQILGQIIIDYMQTVNQYHTKTSSLWSILELILYTKRKFQMKQTKVRFYFYFCFIETNSNFVVGLGLEGQTTIFCFVSFGLVFCSVIYYILTTVLPASTPPRSPNDTSTPLKIHSSSIFFQKRIDLPGISTGHGIQFTKRLGTISHQLLSFKMNKCQCS